MAAPALLPELAPSLLDAIETTEPYMVVLFNDDVTPFDLVVRTLMLATNCPQSEAELEAWEAHTLGKTSVHFGSREECAEAVEVLGRAGITAEVRREWLD